MDAFGRRNQLHKTGNDYIDKQLSPSTLRHSVDVQSRGFSPAVLRGHKLSRDTFADQISHLHLEMSQLKNAARQKRQTTK